MKTHIAAFLGFVLAAALQASGAFLESDYDGPSREAMHPSPPPPPSPVKPPPRAGEEVRSLIRRLDPGNPYRHGSLVIYPLRLRNASVNNDIRTLDEAIRRDWISVREHTDARVSGVRVRNDSRHVIFIMAGEIISGGKQNRVVSEDILLPARSQFLDIPVYCVERDRWNGKTDRFEPGTYMVNPGMRKSVMAGASQETVWRDAEAQAESAGVSSPTRSYTAMYSDDKTASRLSGITAGFRGFCRNDVVGAVIVRRGAIISCDIFADPDVFARLWDKILMSAALDVLNETSGQRWLDDSLGSRDVRRFLDRAANADYEYTATAGAGRKYRIDDGVSGSAISWDDEPVHVILYEGRMVVPLRRDDDGIRPMPLPEARPDREQQIWK